MAPGHLRDASQLPALTAMAPALHFHKRSAKGNALQRNNQGHCQVASPSTKTVTLSRSERLQKLPYRFVLPTSPDLPCVKFIWNDRRRIWGRSLSCVAERGGKRQRG